MFRLKLTRTVLHLLRRCLKTLSQITQINPPLSIWARSATYRKLEERSRAFAAYLQNGLGLKKGDRVAFNDA